MALAPTAEIPQIQPRRTLDYPRWAPGRRLLALLIDSFLIGLLMWWVLQAYGVTVVTGGSIPIPGVPQNGGFSESTVGTEVPWVLPLVVYFGYFLFLELLFRRTPGKAVTGLAVASTDLGPATWKQLLLRNLVRPVDALGGLSISAGTAFYLWGAVGVVVALFTSRHQRLGDLIARTVVIDAKAVPVPWPRGLAVRAGGTVAVVAAFVVAFAVLAYQLGPVNSLRSEWNQGQLQAGDRVSTGYRVDSVKLNGEQADVHLTFFLRGGGTCSGDYQLSREGFGSPWRFNSGETHCPPA